MEGEVIELELKEYGSKLEDVVCNHGFFMMAPNNWNTLTKTLKRPLRLADSTSVNVSISHIITDNRNFLSLTVDDHRLISSSDRQIILDQVERMLRISKKDEKDVVEFQKLHPQANKKGFGRLFRAPTLFEDIIKSLLLCHCGIGRSLEMAENLCKLQYKLTNTNTNTTCDNDVDSTRRSKRKLLLSATTTTIDDIGQILGNFPNSKELSSVDVDILEEKCNLGFRAVYIVNLAKKVEKGIIKLNQFEQETSSKKLYDKLMRIEGFGPFVCANILMCLGFYDQVPIDTETLRHLCQVHQVKKYSRGKKIKEEEEVVENIYGKYAPFQCLAYWFELVEYYESKFGKLSELHKSSYNNVSGFLDDKHKNKIHFRNVKKLKNKNTV